MSLVTDSVQTNVSVVTDSTDMSVMMAAVQTDVSEVMNAVQTYVTDRSSQTGTDGSVVQVRAELLFITDRLNVAANRPI